MLWFAVVKHYSFKRCCDGMRCSACGYRCRLHRHEEGFISDCAEPVKEQLFDGGFYGSSQMFFIFWTMLPLQGEWFFQTVKGII